MQTEARASVLAAGTDFVEEGFVAESGTCLVACSGASLGAHQRQDPVVAEGFVA